MNNLSNKEYLQGFDAKSIKKIALGEFEIALSRTVDGKRKTFTKSELIEMIIEKVSGQVIESVEVSTIEVVPESNEKVVNESPVQDSNKVIEQLLLSEIIPFTIAKLKDITCKQELIEFKNKLLASFNSKQQTRKRVVKSKWATQYNRLTLLFKQAELKLK